MLNIVQQWFGRNFTLLDPLLQQLHTQGGVLHGDVEILVGKGFAGFVGRRLAAKLGIPLESARTKFQVNIHSDNNRIFWSRCFNDTNQMNSTFAPVGTWPAGFWLEQTGLFRLALDVELNDGGWYWRPRKAWLGIVRVPLWLIPKTTAYKRIENGGYFFYVGFSLPILGHILSYSGILIANTTELRD